MFVPGLKEASRLLAEFHGQALPMARMFAPQHGIPVRKPSEPIHNAPMMFRVAVQILDPDLLKQHHTPSLHRGVLTVHERHVEKLPLPGAERCIEPQIDGMAGKRQGYGISRIGLGRIPEDIA